MIEEIISWIDKNLKVVCNTELFKKYFSDIEIVSGINTYYLTNKSKGFEIIISKDSIITSIHFFSGNDGSYKPFTDELPFNVKFSFNRDDIQEVFGKPNKSGGGHKSLYLDFIPFWDKYFFDSYSLRFQYSKDSTETITIASLKLEKYLNSDLQ